MRSVLCHRVGAVLAAVLIAGCAANPAYEDAKQLIALGQVDEGIAKLEQAARNDPGDARLRNYYQSQRHVVVTQRLIQAEQAVQSGSYDEAERLYAWALKLDAGNAAALDGLQRVRRGRAHATQLESATEQLAGGDTQAAEATVRAVLSESPGNREARRLMARIGEAGLAAAPPPVFKAASGKPVTLEFREASLKAVFEVLARAAGVNFVFDKDVNQNIKVSIFVRDAGIDDIVKLILTTNQLEHKVLNDNTLLVYPDTPVKRRQYKDLVVRSFYLANADVKAAQNLIKSMIKTRDVFVDEKLNMLVMKDTPDAVDLAGKLLALQDLAEPEVTLEVEVLELGANKLQNLGIDYPDSVSIGVPATGGNTGLLPGNVILNSSTDIRAFVANPVAVANLKQQDSTINTLANPRIRVRNREKARILIGEKVPVITTTSTANVGVSSSITFVDVGLKLEVEPTVFLGDEVAIKVGLEVSSILEIIEFSGARAFRIGTRTANTLLQLRDGETQVLAGLIQDEDRRTTDKLPGFGDFPVLGRLFSTSNDTKNKTEVVLLITPRIVRNLDRPEMRVTRIPSGTESDVGVAPLSIKTTAPRSLSLASRNGRGPAAASAPVPALPRPSEGEAPAAAAAPRVAFEASAPARVAPGQEFTVSLALPQGGSAQLDLVYDSNVLSPVLPSGTVQLAPPGGGPGPLVAPPPAGGRMRIDLGGESAGGLAQVRFRVIASSAGDTQIRFENVSATDASGQPVPAPARAPLTVAIVGTER